MDLQKTQVTLSDKAWARWSALLIVAFTMMAAYYVNDVMAPLKSMLEGELHWTSGEWAARLPPCGAIRPTCS